MNEKVYESFHSLVSTIGNGLHKVRLSISSKSKSHGARVITYTTR